MGLWGSSHYGGLGTATVEDSKSRRNPARIPQTPENMKNMQNMKSP